MEHYKLGNFCKECGHNLGPKSFNEKACIKCGWKLPLKGKTDGGATVPCSDGLSDAHKNDLIMAFAEGYEAGEADAIDGGTKDATDRAIDWFIDAKEAGIIQGI